MTSCCVEPRDRFPLSLLLFVLASTLLLFSFSRVCFPLFVPRWSSLLLFVLASTLLLCFSSVVSASLCSCLVGRVCFSLSLRRLCFCSLFSRVCSPFFVPPWSSCVFVFTAATACTTGTSASEHVLRMVSAQPRVLMPTDPLLQQSLTSPDNKLHLLSGRRRQWRGERRFWSARRK